MEDEPQQEALFYLQGPDERGCVQIHGANSRDPWTHYLGPNLDLFDGQVGLLGDRISEL